MSNFSDVGNVGNVDKREEASFERNLRDENVITEKNGGEEKSITAGAKVRQRPKNCPAAAAGAARSAPCGR